MDSLSVLTRIITFTGAQGTGKTATRRELVRWMQHNNYSVIDTYSGIRHSVARDAKKFGFVINEQTNFESQYYIACKYMVADIETRKNAEKNNIDFIVLDRSVLDVIPYTMISKNINGDQKVMITKLLMEHFALFPSRLIYCQLLDFVTWDEDRSANTKFQKEIDDVFNYIVKKAAQFSNPFVLKKGPIEKRLEWVIRELGIGNPRI